MHTGVISFCDRIAFNIKSSEIKDDILKEVEKKYQISVLQKHWHNFDDRAIEHIRRIPHLACLRSNGNPYFLYFSKYEDVPIIYYIDKKIQPGYQKPRIILTKGLWDDKLFNGTIIDGEMVKTKIGSWVFLINDMIAYEGRFLWDESLPMRLEYVNHMLKNQHTPDIMMDLCDFHLKKYAFATKEGVNALIEFANDLNYTNRGIYFWAFSAKFKPKLKNFDDSLIKTVIRKVKDNPEFIMAKPTSTETLSQIPPSPPKTILQVKSDINEDGLQTMWLRKTENPDVYDVYTTYNGMVQGTKVGIANVATMRDSQMLRSIFKDATVAMYFPFLCKLNEKTNKWQPIKLQETV